MIFIKLLAIPIAIENKKEFWKIKGKGMYVWASAWVSEWVCMSVSCAGE